VHPVKSAAVPKQKDTLVDNPFGLTVAFNRASVDVTPLAGSITTDGTADVVNDLNDPFVLPSVFVASTRT